MKTYHLGFISDQDIYNHVRDTVLKYKTYIDLKQFNQNVIDPIKLTFDAKVYGKSFEEIIEAECIRQIDKGNTNHIGYFHQNLFRYAGNGWEVPEAGFDVVNEEKHIYCELKNKHNTMNAASSAKTYMKMQSKLLEDDKAVCYLVEVIAKKSDNDIWGERVDGHTYKHERIRRVSMDKFYDIVFGDRLAFFKLCKKLPAILDDVMQDLNSGKIENHVYDELQTLSTDTLKSLYLLAFKKYDGFEQL